MLSAVEADEVSTEDLFLAIEQSGARALLIGRAALVTLGLPMLTADYDLWVHIDDIERLNDALLPLGLAPNHLPTEARKRGRYVLENGEHVDVMIARAMTTPEGDTLTFDDLWANRVAHKVGRASIHLPSIPDLIRTKRLGSRPKDSEDIRLLLQLSEGDA